MKKNDYIEVNINKDVYYPKTYQENRLKDITSYTFPKVGNDLLPKCELYGRNS